MLCMYRQVYKIFLIIQRLNQRNILNTRCQKIINPEAHLYLPTSYNLFYIIISILKKPHTKFRTNRSHRIPSYIIHEKQYFIVNFMCRVGFRRGTGGYGEGVTDSGPFASADARTSCGNTSKLGTDRMKNEPFSEKQPTCVQIVLYTG